MPLRAAGQDSAYEPRALQLLKQMAETYAKLPAFQEETVFSSSIIFVNPPKPVGLPDDPPAAPSDAKSGEKPEKKEVEVENSQGQENRTRVRLLAQRPNRLRLEMRETDPSGKVTTSQWVSDGKTFWSYLPEKNAYTKEKAPARLSEFSRLSHLTSGSLEMLMLLGVNPFSAIQGNVDSVRCTGEAVVRDVKTDIVTMEVLSPGERTAAHFYIGHEDFLLHRLVTETFPVDASATPTPGKIGDGLDDLIEDAKPTKPLHDPDSTAPRDDAAMTDDGVKIKRTSITCDNIITPNPTFVNADFAFVVPAGALLYQAFELNPKDRISSAEYLRRLVKSIKEKNKQSKHPPKVIR